MKEWCSKTKNNMENIIILYTDGLIIHHVDSRIQKRKKLNKRKNVRLQESFITWKGYSNVLTQRILQNTG